MSDSPALVVFAIGLVNFVHKLPDGQVKFFGGIQITEERRDVARSQLPANFTRLKKSLPPAQIANKNKDMGEF